MFISKSVYTIIFFNDRFTNTAQIYINIIIQIGKHASFLKPKNDSAFEKAHSVKLWFSWQQNICNLSLTLQLALLRSLRQFFFAILQASTSLVDAFLYCSSPQSVFAIRFLFIFASYFFSFFQLSISSFSPFF